jgi:hypothetical protein
MEVCSGLVETGKKLALHPRGISVEPNLLVVEAA